jgi:hypothetical protein
LFDGRLVSRRAPWYITRQAVADADMFVAFRQALIAADSQRVRLSSLWVITEGRAHRPEFLEVQAAWAAADLNGEVEL